ncbi:hypothetical protein A2774_01395 [Candidatus Roizmanbacteria bacterium RIFCSPHIGHO2_01_FULL_39_12c]|uniref:Transport permease protein n=1 Tax=Candidatus Roizmanbacteria bacterium RIFCSPHIGHO2_01_FULL_39_12c TaxID=1802031 RepID=A0A1F7G826_9BACT|nr:MAG: hypothetical protein A2774_01395 [Candidatus Roizmanbacteria bacterium RIFCSPHIGHO2_01_FULL_39_12c]OGK46562.1 MAG: hypothetical protein A2963_02405 [Candidatus Roizmanbacteria bacterium RIFCSPLOWO2_01_FULL_40_13]
MKNHRIYGMILRYMYYFKHSFDRISDTFYWPTLDLVMWGLTSVYAKSFMPQGSQIILVILSGIIFWIIIWRGQYEITVNLLEELWNRNLVNIFSSPLKFSEWVVSFIIVGVIKAIISFTFAVFMAFLLYKIKVFELGFYVIPFIISLLLTGWCVGFFVAGIILRFGSKLQTLAWSFVWVLGPFSAIYYPVSLLPEWAQIVSSALPTSYIFEGLREVIYSGRLDYSKLMMSFALNSVYLIFSLAFLKASFAKVLEKGLVKVY